jgi:hypothetical protein
MDRVLQVDRELVARGNPIWNKTWNADKQTNDLGGLSKEELATYNYIEAVTPAITAEIGSALKAPGAQNTPVNLSGTYFSNGDWSGIDFTGVNLENINLNRIDLRSAALKGVTQFTGSYFYYTAWWEAKSINRPLLEHLMQSPQFKPGTYGPRGETVSQDEYKQAVQRLISQSK